MQNLVVHLLQVLVAVGTFANKPFALLDLASRLVVCLLLHEGHDLFLLRAIEVASAWEPLEQLFGCRGHFGLLRERIGVLLFSEFLNLALERATQIILDNGARLGRSLFLNPFHFKRVLKGIQFKFLVFLGQAQVPLVLPERCLHCVFGGMGSWPASLQICATVEEERVSR